MFPFIILIIIGIFFGWSLIASALGLVILALVGGVALFLTFAYIADRRDEVTK